MNYLNWSKTYPLIVKTKETWWKDVEEKYGIKRLDVGYNNLCVVDEEKYLLFLLKYSS